MEDQSKPKRIKDILSAHKESLQKPEWDWYEAAAGQPVKLTLLSGKTVVGTLVTNTTYCLIVQIKPTDYPIIFYKHGLLSIER